MGKVDHSAYGNDWIWSLLLIIVSIILAIFNTWIAFFVSLGALFFGISAIKAGNKLGYLGVIYFILVIISLIVKLFLWQHVMSMLP